MEFVEFRVPAAQLGTVSWKKRVIFPRFPGILRQVNGRGTDREKNMSRLSLSYEERNRKKEVYVLYKLYNDGTGPDRKIDNRRLTTKTDTW